MQQSFTRFIKQASENSQMKPITHFLFSLALAALLYPLYRWKALFVFSGGFLTDIDHYFWYVYRYKKINFFKAYRFFSEQIDENDFSKNYGILLIFHSIEFLLCCIALSFFNAYALIFTLGLLLHYALDLIFLHQGPKRLVANHSILHWIYVNKIQKL